MKSGNLTLGMDQVKNNIVKKNINLILTSKDISKTSLKEITYSAQKHSINIKNINYTKDEIYSATGKYAAIIGISGKNFVSKINTLIEIENTDPQHYVIFGRN